MISKLSISSNNTIRYNTIQCNPIQYGTGKEKGVVYKVSVSFLEVYNENIRDLLNDSEEFLDLREDPIKGAEQYEMIKKHCFLFYLHRMDAEVSHNINLYHNRDISHRLFIATHISFQIRDISYRI